MTIRTGKGFKHMVSQAVALDRKTYNDIVSHRESYLLTHKADGLRTLLMLMADGTHRIVNGNTWQTQNIAIEQHKARTILDTEMIGECFLVFDALAIEGKDLTDLPFRERWATVQKHLMSAETREKVKLKEYASLSANYATDISNFFAKRPPYETDGLIFTQTNQPYYRTTSYKWKPAEHQTIDFLAVRCPPELAPIGEARGKGQCFMLMNGMPTREVRELGVPLPPKYLNLVPALDLNAEYMPVPFTPSLVCAADPKFMYSELDLHLKIVELLYHPDPKAPYWEFIKERLDRKGEPGYFGNNHRFAEQNFMLCVFPLTLNEASQSSQYFNRVDDRYKDIRNYNNMVKAIEIEQYSGNKGCIIDLASGKGQDLGKYRRGNVQKLIMIERDIDAIEEIVRRKYSISSDTKKGTAFTRHSISVRDVLRSHVPRTLGVIAADLLEPEHVLPLLRGLASCFMKPRVIFCHLALHYLVYDKEHAHKIGAFIGALLPQDAEFAFCSLDGKAVHDLLQEHEGHWAYPNKDLWIKRLYNPGVFQGFGHEVELQIPCSATPYKEFLIDLVALDSVFKEYGLIRVSHSSFAEYENAVQMRMQMQKHMPMSSALGDIERQFVSLYAFTKYKKM
jgi:hypothetical protein